jgi:hypothetical protein
MSEADGKRGLSRRVFLGSACGGVLCLYAATAATAQSKKMTRKEVGYRDEPNDGLPCSACALFLEPKYCVILDGAISPNGTCNYFAHVE